MMTTRMCDIHAMLLVINGGTADGFEREIDDQHDKIDWDGKEPVHRLQPDDI